MATLLLELFSEEIPSRMQRAAAEQLQRLMLAGFEKAGLTPDATRTFVSPRHLAIQLTGLPTIQPDVREERKGPKVGAPEQAMKGFLTAVGLTAEQCEQRDGYYYATIERKGQPTADVAKKIIEDTLTGFSWPKSMKWGSRPLQWVRPLHRIVALLDSAIIPVQFAHLSASNLTEGHRFLSRGTLTITHADNYEATLKAAHVVVDFATRRDWIATEIAALAKLHNLTVVPDDELLNEVTGLVEWPVPLLCEFDQKFLDLPPEVLISEMKTHQRYFALQSADGKLSHQFITVANMTNADGGEKVRAGNARVVRARLSDGEFYWEQDKKTPLDAWAKKLADVVFHAKVGMMNEKVDRIEALSLAIAKAVGFADTTSVARAARLAKADLTSGMVGEFPELQGIMGRYYATAQGEPAAIADAIRDHYLPIGASLVMPESKLACIIAVADRLDSIVSLFNAGEKPTGSKDPLALRRAALGILGICYRYDWPLDLASLLDGNTQKDEILAFFRDRLKHKMNYQPHDIMEAVLAAPTAHFISARYELAGNLLSNGLGLPEDQQLFQTTVAAIKRALNILAAEEKKSKTTYSFQSEQLLTNNHEKALHLAILKALAAAEPKNLSLSEALHSVVDSLHQLAAPVNQFFDALLVTEPEHRERRLGLLAGVRQASQSIADFSKIEG